MNRFSIICGVINLFKLVNAFSRKMVSPKVHYPKFNNTNHATLGNLYKFKEPILFTTPIFVFERWQERKTKSQSVETRLTLWRR
jgi:hypothetical protein